MEDSQGATTEVENVVEEQPKSMDDTLRETLDSIRTRSETSDEIPVVGKNLAEDGKFAKTEESPTEVTSDQEKPLVENTPTVDPVVTAPNTWKKEAQATWAALPEVARQEIAKREGDFHKGIEQYKQAATFAQSISQIVAPYEATLRSLNVTPDKAIAELMAADHRLRYSQPQDKAAYFKQLAQNYGIDLNSLGQTEQENEYIDPTVSQLQNEVQQLRAFQQNQQFQVQQQVSNQVNTEIQTFASDPSHNHFPTVREQMGHLMTANTTLSLKDAYEQAIWANPTIRPSLLQQQAESQRQENAKKAQAAKQAASVNVRSRSSMPISKPIGTMEETIRDTYQRLTGRA